MRSIINPDDMSTNVNGWSMNMSSRVLIRMMKTMILINLYFVSLKLVPILHFIITMIRTQLSSLPAHTNN